MTRNKLLGLLGAMAVLAFASGCSSDSCSTNADCADKGSNFVCVNTQCVQNTPQTNTYTVGGTVSGLSGTLVLQDNGGDDTTLTSDGSFTFATALDDASSYAVTVKTQPAGQTCSVANGTGTVSGANVSNVTVTCVNNQGATYTVGGNVSGLSGAVVLQNNGGDDLTVNADGGFAFATAIADGSNYAVTVKTQPSGQMCSVSNGSGTVSGANVTNVSVTCANVPTYTVGGTVSGLTGTLVLTDNNVDDLTVTQNGTFTFNQALYDTTNYSATVKTQPAGQTCSVANGSGTINAANVSNIAVTCVTNNTTCSVQTDCSISQDCVSSACTNVDVTTASTAIAQIRSDATAGTTTSTTEVNGAIVTYVVSSAVAGSNSPGFFVQAEQSGPGLFVAIDPANADGAGLTLNVGDRIDFVASTLAYTNHLPQDTAVSSLTVLSTGHDASLLRSDVSAIDFSQTANITANDSKLISLGFTVAANPTSANTGYLKAQLTSTGTTTASSSFVLYLPSTFFSDLDITSGCVGTLTNGVLYRYGKTSETAEPASWNESEISLTSCPAPKLVSAVAVSATEVDLTFDRNINPTTITIAGFTITDASSNILAVTGATAGATARTVVLTTASQTGGASYTVTVNGAAPTVTDDRGSAVASPDNTATFSGFLSPATLQFTEMNPNIATSAGGDLMELKVTNGGSLANMKVVEMSGSSYYTVVAFPSVTVATGDVILVHLYTSSTNNINQCTETTTKSDCAAGTTGLYAYGDSWWDFTGTGGFSYFGKVVAVMNPDGTTLTAGAAWFKTGSSPSANYGQAVATLEADNLWTGSNGCVDNTTLTQCEADAANWTGLGSGTDTSVQRQTFTEPGNASQWTVTAAGGATFGTVP